jgi:hypothetical protein
LGSKDEINTHIEYIRKSVIQPYQKQLLGVFDKLLTLKTGVPTTLEIKPMSVYLVGDLVEQPTVVDTPETPTQI